MVPDLEADAEEESFDRILLPLDDIVFAFPCSSSVTVFLSSSDPGSSSDRHISYRE